jgi:hypothetical protein
MSAFSNCNGPEHGGASLPQVITLERLISEIGVLSGHITTLRNDLTNHNADALAHPAIRALITALSTTVDTVRSQVQAWQTGAGSIDSTYERKGVAQSAAQGYTDGKIGTLPGGALNVGAAVTAAEAKTAAEATTRISEDAKIMQYIATNLSVMFEYANHLLKVDTIQAFTANGKIAVKDLISAIKGIQGLLFPDGYIDYRNMWKTSGQLVAVANVSPAQQVILLGVLSDVWDPEVIAAHRQTHKPARAYIKYPNSRPWNAIIDMTATIETADPKVYTGSIFALTSKTAERETITFGLYHGTGVDGIDHIYLGVIVDDITNYIYQSGPIQFFIGGVNFLPLLPNINDPLYSDYKHNFNFTSNGGVHEITKAEYRGGKGGAWVDTITASNGVYADHYYDLAGHPVLTTDEAGNLLILGDPDSSTMHQLDIYSSDRPAVIHNDYSRHQIAYLSDLSQSVYWQRAVTVITDTPVTLAGLTVWVNASGAIVAPNTQGATEVPGYYTVDPTSATPAGVIFANMVNVPSALVKSYGTGQVADGFLNAMLDPAASAPQVFDLAKLTGVANIVVGGIDPSTLDGTTFIDQSDPVRAGKVVGVDYVLKTLTVINVNPTIFFRYTTPAYYTFNKATLVWNFESEIPVPTTFDGIVHDVTYEWSGAAIPQDRVGNFTDYLVPTYATWTPHHENNVLYPEFVTVPQYNAAWSDTDLPLDGYRSAARQDEVDMSLQQLASMQPDYAERIPTMTFARPEQDAAIIANPAYILHRPWSGIALLDGGSFEEPTVYEGWLVDGGDFTGLAGKVKSALTTPPVPSNEQYRNVIFRLWRGLYTDMPELNVLAEPDLTNVWNNFGFTQRWTQFVDGSSVMLPDRELYVSDASDKTLHRFIPFNSFKDPSKQVFQSVAYSAVPATADPASNTFGTEFSWTDFSTPGTPILKTGTITFISEQITLPPQSGQDGQNWVIEYDYDTVNNKLMFKSPALIQVQENMVFKLNADFNIVRGLEAAVQVAGPDFTLTKILDNITEQHFLPGGTPAPDTTTTYTYKFASDATVAGDDTLQFEIVQTGFAWTINITSPRMAAIEAAIGAEVTRATAAEVVLQNNIDAEVTRATDAEAAEVTRAQAAEGTLQDNIDAEVTRATTAETALNTSISDEVTRATGIEGGLRADLTTEMQNRQQDVSDLNALVSALTAVVNDPTTGLATKANLAQLQAVATQVSDIALRLGGLADDPAEEIPVPPSTGGPYTLNYNPGAAVGTKFSWV